MHAGSLAAEYRGDRNRCRVEALNRSITTKTGTLTFAFRFMDELDDTAARDRAMACQCDVLSA